VVHDDAVKLPTLPGRLNQPLPKVLVLFVATPLLACCGIGAIAAAVGNDPPSTTQTDPTELVDATTPTTTAPTTTAPTTTTAAPTPTSAPAVHTTTAAPPPAPPDPPAPPAGVYYANCAAARAAGAAPLYRGDPGYRPALDRDNDGVACES